MDAGRTRREFLKVAAGGGALLALTALSGCETDGRARATASGTAWEFRSRPDLKPPPVEVTKRAAGTSPGYIFAAAKNGPGESYDAQDGRMILDAEGRLVWFLPVAAEERDAMDFKAQTYRGEPVLTWWEGEHSGYGRGEYVIADASYEEILRFRAGNGYEGDHHEFLLSPRDTAYVTIYHETPMDLSAAGGQTEDVVVDGIAKEIDPTTGAVIFKWRSLEHVGVEESYYELTPDLEAPYDYFHINSIGEDGDEHLLISARRTSAVYKVARATGEVVWRLGGKRSDFEMGEGARFAFQHDARRHPDGTLTLFDNRGEDKGRRSRGIRLRLDEDAMTATLEREYVHPDRFFSIYSESVRNLGTPVFSPELFRVLKEVFGEACEVLTVTKDGAALSSVMSFYFRDEVLPYYGGGLAAARSVAANDFMYWELMRRGCVRGVRIFDFGRSKRDVGSFRFKMHEVATVAHSLPMMLTSKIYTTIQYRG